MHRDYCCLVEWDVPKHSTSLYAMTCSQEMCGSDTSASPQIGKTEEIFSSLAVSDGGRFYCLSPNSLPTVAIVLAMSCSFAYVLLFGTQIPWQVMGVVRPHLDDLLAILADGDFINDFQVGFV